MFSKGPRSHYGTGVDFSNIYIYIYIYIFYGKCCVCSYECVSVVIKIKCVNSSNMSDNCDKLNFITNYTYFTITDTHFIKKKHTYYKF